jgi:hypothetical protein
VDQALDERVEAFRRDVLCGAEAFVGVAWLERTVLVDRAVGLPGGCGVP